MLNIVLPIAGRGRRFVEAGYAAPKPLVPVHGVPMIQIVIGNVFPSRPCRFTFLVLQEHLDRFPLRELLCGLLPDCAIVPVSGVTEGAACTVLLGRDVYDNGDPLMIANSDQWVDASIDRYLRAADDADADGMIMTMWADHPKWSYVGLDSRDRVTRVVEKEVISNHATVGIYNYRRGRDFVRAAESMIARNLRVNGEFYVAPTYNQLIAEGARVVVHSVGREYAGMHGMGTPRDLDLFLASPASQKAVRQAKAIGRGVGAPAPGSPGC